MTKKNQRPSWRERLKYKSKTKALTEEGQASTNLGKSSTVMHQKKSKWRSLRFWMLGILFTVFAPVVLILSLLIAGYFLSKNISSERMTKFVHDFVADKFAASLSIKSIKFDLLEEIDIKEIVFHPTLDTTTKPIFRLDRFHFVYHPFRLIRGEIALDELMFYHPQIYLERNGEKWNFTPLLEKIVDGSSKSEKESKPDKPAAKTLAELIPFNPAMLLLPFKASLQRVGLEQLEFEMKDSDPAAEKETHIQLKNLDIVAGTTWYLRDSHIQVDLKSTGDSALFFSMTGTKKGQTPTHLKADLLIRQTATVDNLENIGFSSNIVVQSIQNGKLKLSELQNSLNIKLAIPPALNSINIKEFKLALSDILQFEQSGRIQLVNGSLSDFNILLNHVAFLDLSATQKFLDLFNVPIQVSGGIRLDTLKVDGPINLERLKQEIRYDELPIISLLVNFDKISAQAPKFSSSINNLTGSLSVQTKPSSLQQAVEVNIDSNIGIEGISTAQSVKGKIAEVKLKSLITNLAAQISYPSPNLHSLKLSTTIESIQAKDGNGLNVKLPVSFDMSGSLTDNLKQSSLFAKARVGDILDFSLQASCENACQKIKFHQMTKIESFRKIFAIAKPVIAKTLPPEQIPSHVLGSLNLQTDLTALISNPKEKNLEKILEKLRASFNIQMNLVDFGMSVPMMDLNLDGLNSKLTVSGDEKKQLIDLDQSFKQVSAKLLNAEQTLSPKIDQQTLKLIVTNTIERLTPLKELPKNTSTELNAKLYIGKVAAEPVLPTALSAITLAVRTQQQQASRVDLQAFEFSIPDLGFNSNIKAFALLKPDFKPDSIGANASVSMKQFGNVPLPMAIKVKGQMLADVAVKSPDMDFFAADGKIAFDHFNLMIPAKEQGKPALIEIDDIDGEIPFLQEISLKALAELQSKLKKSSPQKTEDSPSKASKENPSVAASTDKQATEKDSSEITLTKNDPLPIPVDTDIALSSYLARKKHQAELQNIIPRVDYGKTRDYFPGKRILRISKVSAANLTMRDLEFDMELKKERFALNNFSINFLDGKIHGNLQIPMKLLPQSIHLEMHMTKLNTQRLLDNFPRLKSKTESFLLSSNPVLEGVILFDFDVLQNDIGGAIDITTIGKEQLKMMLYYLDPEEKDGTLGAIRKALMFGDVKSVSIPIKNGYMGMEIDLTALGLPIPLPKVARIPIAQIVKNVMDGTQSAENANGGDGTDEL